MVHTVEQSLYLLGGDLAKDERNVILHGVV
jgi:hypothetical protein